MVAAGHTRWVLMRRCDWSCETYLLVTPAFRAGLGASFISLDTGLSARLHPLLEQKNNRCGPGRTGTWSVAPRKQPSLQASQLRCGRKLVLRALTRAFPDTSFSKLSCFMESLGFQEALVVSTSLRGQTRLKYQVLACDTAK